MQRYFARQCDENGFLYIDGKDFFHIVRVMRMKVNDNLHVVFEQKATLATITSIEENCVKLTPGKQLEMISELTTNVILACALTKGTKWEVVVQKGTELGAHMFIPWQSQRSVVKWNEAKKVAKCNRYQKVVEEAARQSQRTFIPQVAPVATLADIISHYAPKVEIKLIADEESSRSGEVANLAGFCQNLPLGSSILVVFGPEGGFTPEEIEQLVKVDFVRCSLGNRILRAETAPLFVMSVIAYELELAKNASSSKNKL